MISDNQTARTPISVDLVSKEIISALIARGILIIKSLDNQVIAFCA